MDESDALEFWAERAAIMQFDGRCSQPDAEFNAAFLMKRFAERHGIEITNHWLRWVTRQSWEWSDDARKVVINSPQWQSTKP